MAGFELSEWVSRRPQDVFDFITTPDNAPQLVPSGATMVKITDGPMGVGTRLRETRLMRGKQERAELEVVSYEPGQQFALKNVTEGIETVYRYTFHAEANGTWLDLVCEVKASGAKKLLVPRVVGELRKEDGNRLRKLAQALES
jgi:hypothetical protein